MRLYLENKTNQLTKTPIYKKDTAQKSQTKLAVTQHQAVDVKI